MKNLVRLLILAIALTALTTIVAASGPPASFSATGYTVNAILEPLPNGDTKFYISARGEPDNSNDAFCMAAYGAPCQALCLGATTEACGVDGYFNGSFTFEEWGVGNLETGVGTNYGNLNITTAAGDASLRFNGLAAGGGVTGSFDFSDGSGDYRDIEGGGIYSGGAGFIFQVQFGPCGTPGTPECMNTSGTPADKCVVYGDKFKLNIENDKAILKIANEGTDKITISRIMFVWPAGNGPLAKVRLEDNKILDGPLAAPYIDVSSGWSGPQKDREIKKGETRKLRFVFDQPISPNLWDYTVIVEFAEGCTVSYAAFNPAP